MDQLAELAVPEIRTYTPSHTHRKIYDALYAEYMTLYRYFGRENNVMKRIRKLAE